MKKFIGGLLFAIVGIPLLEGLVDTVNNYIQLHSCQIAKKIYVIKDEINKMAGDEEETREPVGFQYVAYETDDGSEEEEEEV